MNESVFWVFNGWGILFFALYLFSFVLHFGVTLKLGSGVAFTNTHWCFELDCFDFYIYSIWMDCRNDQFSNWIYSWLETW